MGWNEGCITRESMKHNRTEQENDCLRHLLHTLHGLWVSSSFSDIYQGQLTIILFVVENKWIGRGKMSWVGQKVMCGMKGEDDGRE